MILFLSSCHEEVISTFTQLLIPLEASQKKTFFFFHSDTHDCVMYSLRLFFTRVCKVSIPLDILLSDKTRL